MDKRGRRADVPACVKDYFKFNALMKFYCSRPGMAQGRLIRPRCAWPGCSGQDRQQPVQPAKVERHVRLRAHHRLGAEGHREAGDAHHL